MGHQRLGVCEVSYTYLLGKHGKDMLNLWVSVFVCKHTVVHIIVMWLVLRPSVMVISITGILLYAKVSSLPFVMQRYLPF